MMSADEALMAARKRDREWAQTEIGKLFYAYERAYSSAWVKDTEAGFRDNVSDRRLRETWDNASVARGAFLLALRGFE